MSSFFCLSRSSNTRSEAMLDRFWPFVKSWECRLEGLESRLLRKAVVESCENLFGKRLARSLSLKNEDDSSAVCSRTPVDD